VAQRVGRGIALLFHDLGTRRGEGSALRSGRSLLLGKTRYPLYRRLGGPQGRSGQVRKISPPPGFDPRTVQSVASRYTDYATRLTRISEDIILETKRKMCFVCGVALLYYDNFEAVRLALKFREAEKNLRP